MRKLHIVICSPHCDYIGIINMPNFNINLSKFIDMSGNTILVPSRPIRETSSNVVPLNSSKFVLAGSNYHADFIQNFVYVAFSFGSVYIPNPPAVIRFTFTLATFPRTTDIYTLLIPRSHVYSYSWISFVPPSTFCMNTVRKSI